MNYRVELIQLSPRLLPCKSQRLVLALPQPPRVQGPTGSLPCFSAQGTRPLEPPPNVSITGGYSFSSVSSALLLSIVVRVLRLGSSAVKCTCYRGLGAPVVVCLRDPLLEFSAVLPAYPRPVHPAGALPVCSRSRASHALFPFPAHFLFFTCPTLKGAGLPYLTRPCHWAWEIHKYLLNEREVLWGLNFLPSLSPHMSDEMTRALPCSRKLSHSC